VRNCTAKDRTPPQRPGSALSVRVIQITITATVSGYAAQTGAFLPVGQCWGRLQKGSLRLPPISSIYPFKAVGQHSWWSRSAGPADLPCWAAGSWGFRFPAAHPCTPGNFLQL
jgi:hypothetical protein